MMTYQHQLHCLKSSVIDLHYQHQLNLQHEQSPSLQPITKTLPSAKHLLFNESYPMECASGIKTSTNLANFSNSDPHLCDQFVHDVNCAKNKTPFLNNR